MRLRPKGPEIENIISKNDKAFPCVTAPVTVEASTTPSLVRQLGLGIEWSWLIRAMGAMIQELLDMGESRKRMWSSR